MISIMIFNFLITLFDFGTQLITSIISKHAFSSTRPLPTSTGSSPAAQNWCPSCESQSAASISGAADTPSQSSVSSTYT